MKKDTSKASVLLTVFKNIKINKDGIKKTNK